MFWYVSDDKLRTIVERRGWLDRLKPTLALGPPGVGVQFEVEPRSQTSLQRMVEKAERKIARDGGATSMATAVAGPPPKLFTFNGAAGRLVDQGVFWVAGVHDESAFLLAGSVANAIGTSVRDEGRLSPTADPVGAIRELFRTLGPSGLYRRAASYIWETIVEATADSGGLDAAPRVAGVAVYAGRTPLESYAPRQESGTSLLLFIGSPLFVEQV